MSNIVWLRPEFTRQVEDATAEVVRETRRKIAECRHLRAESERVRRGYIERRVQIERLLERIEADVERA